MNQQALKAFSLRAAMIIFVLGVCLPALGAVDMFIKIEGIEGESKDSTHDKWIDVLSFSHSVSRPVSTSVGGGPRGSVAQAADIIITKRVDKSSPKLALACTQGSQHREAVLQVVNQSANSIPTIEYTLTNVQVTSYSVQAVQGGPTAPTEEIALNFESIQWKYVELDKNQRKKEDHVTFWDFVTNKGGK